MPSPAPEFDKDIVWKNPDSADSLEKLMGEESTLLPISFLEMGLKCSQSVARVRLANGGLGSGFLTKENIFVTNNHVFRNPDEAKDAVIQFNYQQNIEGLNLESKDFSLDPDNGFVTSPEDDWTIIKVAGDS